MKKFMAYLLDGDSVAYGLGDVEFGDTREEAVEKLKDAWHAGLVDDHLDLESAWNECVEDGEGREAWSVEKMRMFVKEVRI